MSGNYKKACHPGRAQLGLDEEKNGRDPGPTGKLAPVSEWVLALRDVVRSLSLTSKSLGRDDSNIFVLGAV